MATPDFLQRYGDYDCKQQTISLTQTPGTPQIINNLLDGGQRVYTILVQAFLQPIHCFIEIYSDYTFLSNFLLIQFLMDGLCTREPMVTIITLFVSSLLIG